MDTAIVLESDDDDIIVVGEKLAVVKEESDDDVIFIPTRRRKREAGPAQPPGPSTSANPSPIDCMEESRRPNLPELPPSSSPPTEAEIASAVDSITPMMTTDTTAVDICIPYFFGMDYKSTSPQANQLARHSSNMANNGSDSVTRSQQSTDMDSVALPSAESLGIPLSRNLDTAAAHTAKTGNQNKGLSQSASVSWANDTSRGNMDSQTVPSLKGFDYDVSDSNSSDSDSSDDDLLSFKTECTTSGKRQKRQLLSDISDWSANDSDDMGSDQSDNDTSILSLPSISITTSRQQNTTTCTIRQSIDPSNNLPDLDDQTNSTTGKDTRTVGWVPAPSTINGLSTNDRTSTITGSTTTVTGHTTDTQPTTSQQGSSVSINDQSDNNDDTSNISLFGDSTNNSTVSDPSLDNDRSTPLTVFSRKADGSLNDSGDSDSEADSDDSVVLVAIKRRRPSSNTSAMRLESIASDNAPNKSSTPAVDNGAGMDQSVSSTTSPVDQQATVLLDKINRTSLAQHEQFLTGYLPVPPVAIKPHTSAQTAGNNALSASLASQPPRAGPSEKAVPSNIERFARHMMAKHPENGLLCAHMHALHEHHKNAAAKSSDKSVVSSPGGSTASATKSLSAIDRAVMSITHSPCASSSASQSAGSSYDSMLSLFDNGDSLPTISGPTRKSNPTPSISALKSSVHIKSEKDAVDLSTKKQKVYRNIMLGKGKFQVPKLVVKIKHEFNNQDWSSYYDSNSGSSSAGSCTTPGTPSSPSGGRSPSGLFKRKLPPANIAAIKYHMSNLRRAGDNARIPTLSNLGTLPPSSSSATNQQAIDTSQIPFKKRNFGKDMANVLNDKDKNLPSAWVTPIPANVAMSNQNGSTHRGLQPHSQNPFMSSIIRTAKTNQATNSTPNTAMEISSFQLVPGTSGQVTWSGPFPSTSGHVTISQPTLVSPHASNVAPPAFDVMGVVNISSQPSTSAGNCINPCTSASTMSLAGTSTISLTGTGTGSLTGTGSSAMSGKGASSLTSANTLPAPVPSTSQEADQAASSDSGSVRRRSLESDVSYTCKHCLNLTLSQEISRCMSWHGCCGQCLRQEVKKLLATNKKGALRCVYPGCDSYYSTTELKRALPGILVEILEEKLDSYAIDMVADEMPVFNPSQGTPDFGKMETVDSNKSGGPRLVKLPGYWEPMDPDSTDFKLVVLDPSMNEHIMVKEMFHQTMSHPRAKILKITRVQNPVLYQFYCVKRNQMKKNSGLDYVAERLLFHGTSKEVVESICKTNFDWRLSGKHAAAYGEGTYFARDASYSHSYTDTGKLQRLTMAQRHSHIRNRHQSVGGGGLGGSVSLTMSSLAPAWVIQNWKSQRLSQAALSSVPVSHNMITSVSGQMGAVPNVSVQAQPQAGTENMMFLAHVLVGNYTIGRAGYRKPPPIDATNPFGKCYDSCVNCMKDPAIYVIFESAQVYPEYIVEYTNDQAEF